MGATLIDLVVLVVLGCAAYRATQLVVHDTILDPVRDRLYAWHGKATTSVVRSAAVTLIACTYCAGWWLAGAILATYLLVTGQFGQAPLLVHGIEWLAVAGVQALLNRWDDTRPAVEV
ncbi:DUF1360 domain-containing protein [Streptomyces sp. NPDC059605]|uniref:DUF1360 domain-containing protein n=1 Tax=Streptomyces sp. NPDC059605 TaxID=3346882 RepID=UPI0036749DDF